MNKAKQSFASSTYCASFHNKQLKLYFKRDHIKNGNKKIIYLKINLSGNKQYQYEEIHKNLLIHIRYERQKNRGIKIL